MYFQLRRSTKQEGGPKALAAGEPEEDVTNVSSYEHPDSLQRLKILSPYGDNFQYINAEQLAAKNTECRRVEYDKESGPSRQAIRLETGCMRSPTQSFEASLLEASQAIPQHLHWDGPDVWVKRSIRHPFILRSKDFYHPPSVGLLSRGLHYIQSWHLERSQVGRLRSGLKSRSQS
jgi:hypothetical protein